MDVRPIRTPADHAAALAEVATLMDAGMGTPAGGRLDVLVTLVEAYEAAHAPVPMVRALSRLLDIPADLLIQPYATGKSVRGRDPAASAA